MPVTSELPAAVFLDLDGTLIDSESFHAEGIARFMAERGYTLSADEKAFVIGHAWQEIYEALRVGERLGVSFADLQAEAIAAKEALEAEGHEGIAVLSGARELVALLHTLDITTCIVSGSSRREIEHALTKLRFADKLAFYLGCEDYPRGKPAPDGYALAARRLDLAPAACLVFEDSEAGIASAHAAGMRVVASSAANRPRGEPGWQDHREADARVTDLLEVDEEFLRRVMSS